jgi:hypothetical protein
MIIDAVTRHGNDAALAAQVLNHRALGLRQHLCLDHGNAEAARPWRIV